MTNNGTVKAKVLELLVGGAGAMTALGDAGLLLLRVFAGFALMTHGWGKVPPSARFIDGVATMGFPAPELFAWSAGLSELAGGFLLAVGLFTRPAALFIAVTMSVAAFIRHAADPFDVKELALFYLSVATCFWALGSGRFGFDALVRRRIIGA